jgi:hypothetical protein
MVKMIISHYCKNSRGVDVLTSSQFVKFRISRSLFHGYRYLTLIDSQRYSMFNMTQIIATNGASQAIINFRKPLLGRVGLN